VSLHTALGTKFPRFSKNSYEPLFLERRLSWREKLASGAPGRQKLAATGDHVIMLSVLAVAVVMYGDFFAGLPRRHSRVEPGNRYLESEYRFGACASINTGGSIRAAPPGASH